MIRRDGKPVFFCSAKNKRLALQKKKPAKLTWTQAWRRLHKKGLVETSSKKRTRRTTKVQRAVVGISLEEIRKKAAQKPEFRTQQREAAMKEAKARQQKAKDSKKKTSYQKGGPKQKAQKHQGGKGNRAGTQR